MSSTASSGYAPGAVPPASDWNWMDWRQGQWVRHLDESNLRGADLFDAATGNVYRVSATAPTYTVAGPLTQTPSGSGVYWFEGARLVVDPSNPDWPAQTFAAGSTNYVHIRPQQATTARETVPEILVNTTAIVAGYATILQVVTGGATVTSVTDLVSQGIAADLPWTHLAEVVINPATGGPASLDVQFPNSVLNPGVKISPQGGATQDALQVTGGSTGGAVVAEASGADTMTVTQTGASACINATNTGGGIGLAATVATTGAGVSVQASGGANGLFSSVTGGGSPLILVPVALGPTVPTNGDLYLLSGGGVSALRYREGGVTRFAHASQDGPAPFYTINAATQTMPPSTGPTTIASTSYAFRQGGVYRIVWSCIHGGVTTSTTRLSYDCRINGVAQSGANARTFDPPYGIYQANVGGTEFTGTWWYSTHYTHALADGNYTVDFRVTASAGVGNRQVANRILEIICIYS